MTRQSGIRTHLWDPEQYQINAQYVSELGRPVLDLLKPKPRERVLDLGCGDGTLALEIKGFGCKVVGLDSSEEMVEAARSKGVDAILGDGAELGFFEEFDAVFSNASLHWMRPPDAVIAGVCRALRPGGRFVAEFGGAGNVSTIIHALERALDRRGVTAACPWFFPASQEYGKLLEAAGLQVKSIKLFPRPTQLPGDVRGWLETFARKYLSLVADCEREIVVNEVMNELRDDLMDKNQNWIADYVRLRFCAKKPSATG